MSKKARFGSGSYNPLILLNFKSAFMSAIRKVFIPCSTYFFLEVSPGIKQTSSAFFKNCVAAVDIACIVDIVEV